MDNRGGDAFEAKRRHGAVCGRDVGDPHGERSRQMGGRRRIGERAHDSRHELPRGRIVEIEEEDCLLGLCLRQRLDGHVGHSGERAPRAGQKLA